tara:strand:- start:1915 stop:2553 length:639 start_codon:yes stop_codon:yes gene_type:complete
MVRKFRKRICCLKLRRYIYLISPKKIDNSFYFNLKKVLASNKVVFFQLRLKKTTYNNIIKIGKKIKPITDKFKVKLIINDNPKIAKAINADGCHIGQSDKPFSLTKKILKKKIVGVTCHGSKKLVNRAIKYKADYIALGSFFKSNLKPSAKKASLQVLKEVKKKTRIPIVVIGGIDNKNYKKLIKLGANYIAISSFIWNNPALKPEIAIKEF